MGQQGHQCSYTHTPAVHTHPTTPSNSMHAAPAIQPQPMCQAASEHMSARIDKHVCKLKTHTKGILQELNDDDEETKQR